MEHLNEQCSDQEFLKQECAVDQICLDQEDMDVDPAHDERLDGA